MSSLLVFTYNLDSGQQGGQLRSRDHQLCDVLARLLLHPIVPVDIINGYRDNIYTPCVLKLDLLLKRRTYCSFLVSVLGHIFEPIQKLPGLLRDFFFCKKGYFCLVKEIA